jgi:hypothetical protein
MAKTNARNETMFRVDATHNELSLVLVDGPLYNRLVKFFKSFAEVALSNVAFAFQQLGASDKAALKPRDSLSSFPEDIISQYIIFFSKVVFKCPSQHLPFR